MCKDLDYCCTSVYTMCLCWGQREGDKKRNRETWIEYRAAKAKRPVVAERMHTEDIRLSDTERERQREPDGGRERSPG